MVICFHFVWKDDLIISFARPNTAGLAGFECNCRLILGTVLKYTQCSMNEDKDITGI